MNSNYTQSKKQQQNTAHITHFTATATGSSVRISRQRSRPDGQHYFRRIYITLPYKRAVDFKFSSMFKRGLCKL